MENVANEVTVSSCHSQILNSAGRYWMYVWSFQYVSFDSWYFRSDSTDIFARLTYTL